MMKAFVSKFLPIPVLIGILITLLFCGFAIIRWLPFERAELLLYDMRYQIRGKTTPPKEVVIVGIDDRSLEVVGRWPWDRKKQAAVIDSLKAMGARVIVLDIIYSESAPDDDILASSIKKAGNVILPIAFDFRGEKKKIQDDVLVDNAFPMIRNSDNFRFYPPISARSVLLPLKNLSASANSLAYISMFPDTDGVLRWEALGVEYNGEVYPSIDLQAVRVYLNIPIEAMILMATQGVQMGPIFIPTDSVNRTLIRYYGPAGTFPYVSAVDVLEKKADPALIRDKIVLVGATAVGIYDLRVTPTSAAMPGIEKHASVMASILHKEFIRRTSNITNILIVLFSGLVFTFLTIRIKAIFGAVVAVGFIAVIFLLGYYSFFAGNLWIKVSYPINNILGVYLFVTAYRYATEERYAKRIRGMFSSYVTEKVVNELIKNPNLAKLGGERREITVLFSDVRGFTNYSEKHSPEEVVAILNEYLGEMTNVIFRFDGTLDKFVGDEIVAFWGAPVPQENHAQLAIQCALGMIGRLKELQSKWVTEGRVPLSAGFGINTGEVIVGNIGADGKKMDYTVIGDNVNLGARVEGLTRKYDTDIIITESTLEKIRSAISEDRIWRVKVKGLDMVAVKGKAKPVSIYELTGLKKGEKSVIIESEQKEVVTFTEK
jgi:adenylate cyclase